MRINHILKATEACLTLIAIAFVSQAYSAPSSEPTVVNNGSVIILKNPDLDRPGSPLGPTSITTEQMLEAVPMKFSPSPQSPAPIEKSSTYQDNQLNAPHKKIFPPTSPAPGSNNLARRQYPDQWAKLPGITGLQSIATNSTCNEPSGWDPLLDCYYHPWTETPGSFFPQYRTNFPWKAVGKLYFHEYNEPIGHYYHHCTAQVISGPPANLLVTAGHCVISPSNGKPHKDMFFVPAFFNGSQPYGQYKYQMAMALPEFVKTGGSQRYDVALVSLQNGSDGKPVSYYTGSMGLLLNASYIQNLTLMGYSTTQVPDGAWSTMVNGQTYKFVPEESEVCKNVGGDDVLFMGAPVGPGSSGGAWIHSFYPFLSSELNSNLVASVVSGAPVCPDSNVPNALLPPNILMGPRFSDENIGILCQYVAGGCGAPISLMSLAITVFGEGYVTSVPSGLSCGSEAGQSTTCTADFIKDSKVTLSAIPERGGHKFVAWTGECKGNSTTCVVNMNKKRAATAIFE